MAIERSLRAVIVAWIAIFALAPLAAVAADRLELSPKSVVDVKLHDGGTLVGAVYNPDGTAAQHSPVVLLQYRKVIASLKTNEKGQFFVRGVRGGVYELQTANGSGLCRMWAPSTAPPAAHQALVLTASPEIVRGQGRRPFTLFDAYSPIYQAASLGIGTAGLTVGIVALQKKKSGS